MADMDNFSGINENFDTIKTLLNSIRAQGILNTSDVDKLLSGINSKLEKLNTEEDIDLIKIFLSELKQNFEERHSVLISKFGAIESLFTNLLKNSSEMLKSSEVKELFDIVATNLSVFSREVVSQKESLTDISLRIDALRSDDSQKKDIIKNIAVLKSDLERLNNGFDSIVISLNDNFKTIVKTITTIDKTEHLDKFSNNLTNIEMASNTILSALQMVDKKAVQMEESISKLASKDELRETNQKLFEISSQGKEISAYVTELSDKYIKIDNLADKIDASVNIIANLKSVLEDAESKNVEILIEQLKGLEASISLISNDNKFEEFKTSFETILRGIFENTNTYSAFQNTSYEELKRIQEQIKNLNIEVNIRSLENSVKEASSGIKEFVLENSQKILDLTDANITRVINELSSNAEIFTSRLGQSQSAISMLCERSFNSVLESVSNLKAIVGQIEENSVSANNAIFSNITDRLTVFENSLHLSLDSQEKTITDSSKVLTEHMESVKTLAGVLDYKMDSSVVEVGNLKRELGNVKTAVDSLLAQDFINAIKDLRVDLYASKQEMSNSFEIASSDLSQKLTDDLYGKYELMISKLDLVEEELQTSQKEALNSIHPVLEKISSAIVDIISYVSEIKTSETSNFDSKLAEIGNTVKENSLNYVDSVRDIVDVIRIQVENNLKNIEEQNVHKFELVQKDITEKALDLKNDIKFSYSKLLEIQDLNNELREILNVNDINSSNKMNELMTASNVIKSDFETRISNLKEALDSKIEEFKKEFTCENADKISELRFSVENLYNQKSKEINAILLELKTSFSDLKSENKDSRENALLKLENDFNLLKSYISDTEAKMLSNSDKSLEIILADFSEVKDKVSEVNMNLESKLSSNLDSMLFDFNNLKSKMLEMDENIDSDITRLLSIVESNFEALVSQITILFEKRGEDISEKIGQQFEQLTEKLDSSMVQKLDSYRFKIEQVFANLEDKTISQSKYLQERIADLNQSLKSTWELQAKETAEQLDNVCSKMKTILDESAEASAVDYKLLKDELIKVENNLSESNLSLQKELLENLSNIDENISSNIGLVKNVENLINESASIINITNSDVAQLKEQTASYKELINNFEQIVINNFESLKNSSLEVATTSIASLNEHAENIMKELELHKQQLQQSSNIINDLIKADIQTLSTNIEKETDSIISELVEQFDLMKKSQTDDVISITSSIEGIINDQIYSSIEDLKSYLDIKTDNSLLINKFDNLNLELSNSVEEIVSNLNKMLAGDVFNSALADFRLANELLVKTSLDNLSDKFESFVQENINTTSNVLVENFENIDNKLSLFDKKLVETIVDKYEEIKILSNKYNDSISEIKASFAEIISSFELVKSDISDKLTSLIDTIKESNEATNAELRLLYESFEDLKNQISNKSFDEAFQASINKQIGDLEGLISKEFRHIEQINALCSENLPSVTELNSIVKDSILNSIKDFSKQIEQLDIENKLETELNSLKSEILTQLLNIFNQISFESEQEEILDFIYDKHEELVSVLSHIVTSTNEVVGVREDVALVDSKVESLRDELAVINEKVTSILSSDGDIDYIYSLQDLESDIAGLRIVLNEMKQSSQSNELSNLINSTNDIYNLVDSIKSDFPSKRDFEDMAEDIVSISTRTNKLLLASDESYKALQDNLQDFKLVVNDLDERTKNFSRDAGIDRIDSKLNTLNQMIQNGSRNNQIFNQVFEYLAEWVDNASVQINSISDKVETLDEIGQIKTMLADWKAQSEDESNGVELVETLGSVFEKQTKKILSLEAKLDKIIVDSTINNEKNKFDVRPFEDTLNRFLVAMETKVSKQQEKIESLESKLSNLMGILEEKDTAVLTKKVGGMDRQIAKLNKSIEKIASHVIEK